MPSKKVTLTGMRKREELTAWLFISPIVLGIFIFQLYPTIFSFFISFTTWNLLTPPKWVGFSNYLALFTNDRFIKNTMTNTATYALWTVVLGLVLGLIFAALLNQDIRGKYLYRAIYFVPVVAPTVAIAILWQVLYEPNFGVFNGILRMIGVKGPNWLGNSTWAMRSIIFEAIWAGLGFTILIFLAGLQGISQEYYEAAEIDGANFVQKFLFITLPLLSPTTFFLLVTGVIGSFQVFDIPYIMTNGGPGNATQMVIMYLYNLAFTTQRMGMASAVAAIVFLVIILLTIMNFRISKKWVFYE